MPEPTLGNPQNTIAVLQKYNFSFQKNQTEKNARELFGI